MLSLNIHSFVCSLIHSFFIHSTTAGFAVHSIVPCISHTKEAKDTLYQAEPYEASDSLLCLTWKRASLYALS